MIKTIIVIGVSIALGIICGSGCVYAFNHIPDEWLGTDEKGREWQRVKSLPWKYIFTATFIVVGIYLGIKEPQKAAGIYAACLMLTEIAMAGFLYGRVPRPLVWLLALAGTGIIPFTIDEDLGFGAGTAGMIKAHLAGAAAGFVILFILLVIKNVLMNSGRPLVSEADFAFCELGLALGLLCGPLEVSVIIATGIVLWGGYAVSKKLGGAGVIDDMPAGRKKDYEDGTGSAEKGPGGHPNKDILVKRKISESFFVALAAFFWLVVWPF